MKSRNAYMTTFKLFVVAITLTFVSCSGDPKERTAEEALSALVNSNQNVSVFGHVSIYKILNKADYKHIPKVSILIDSQLETWKKAFNLDAPIYFAAEGPYQNDGTPETVYAFMDITSADSVINVIHSLNYATEKAGDITYFQEGDVTCGVRNKLFVLISKGGEYDGKAELQKAFKASEADLSEDKPQDIITSKADLVVGVSLERLFAGANTTLNKLPKAKKDELTELLADGYIQTTLNFNKGEMKLETKNLISEELKDRLWFKDGNNGNDLAKKLGKGTPWMGVSANFDMKKLDKFMKDFSPNGTKDLTSNMGSEARAAMFLSGLDFTTALTGQFGMVHTGNPAMMMAGTPELNAFIGLTNKAKGLPSLMDQIYGTDSKKNGAYMIKNNAIKVKPDGVYMYSVANLNKPGIKIPGFAKNFGKSTFSVFVDFRAMNPKALDLPKGSKVLEIMESAVGEYTRDGGSFTLTAKDKSKNILDQMTDFYYGLFQDELGNFM